MNINGKDLSTVWLTEYPRFNEGKEIRKTEPVGYFGQNYWRFYIHFISIIQNPENPNEYFVYGKNRLKGNISEIQGTLKIESAEVYEEEFSEGIREGIIKGTYQLNEDRKKSGTGKFTGTFETYVMISDNNIQYSTLYWYADGFMNNQFEGTWTSFSSGKSYICNWGDNRIPNRQGFDIGAGQMGVHPDYEKNGWENFELATFPIANSDEHRRQIEEAKKKEAEEWWK
ncbi:hypothetical protein SAMN04488029_3191 [Reichenbachiella faecimaris]|uniref:Uncharacterized protein n=1 Tax=Reichenbachiella faecimaris TaxID=692418 RepID=A0A1W2GKD0_REIFA|nr:hypothetical protein SAMN04488029_3191 [Reichenbachiella faecimaris]